MWRVYNACHYYRSTTGQSAYPKGPLETPLGKLLTYLSPSPNYKLILVLKVAFLCSQWMIIANYRSIFSPTYDEILISCSLRFLTFLFLSTFPHNFILFGAWKRKRLQRYSPQRHYKLQSKFIKENHHRGVLNTWWSSLDFPQENYIVILNVGGSSVLNFSNSCRL